jgi:hypothetical protein
MKIKGLLTWAAFICAGLIGYAVKNTYGIDDFTALIAVTAIWLVVISIHFDVRMNALESRVVHTEYKGIKAQIEEGERHKPNHKQPASLAAGGAVKSFITPADEILFDDFRWFGAVLNRHIAEPWSIEELNNTDARGYDGPDVGRQYHIWYNACRMGRMQVTCGGQASMQPERSAENILARVEIELNYLRFVPYHDALGLISEIALFIGSFDFEDGERSRVLARGEGAGALAGHLWEAVRQSDLDPQFEYSITGPYELLRQTVDHWMTHGIDPFEKWSGDR